MKRQLAVLTAPKTIEIIEEELPRLEPNEVLYRVISGGLCHSEIPTYLGSSSTGPNKYPYMSYNKGVSYPRGVGHEPVCIVEEVGSSVKKFAVGDIVTGHISRSFASHVITGTQGLVKIPRTEKPVEFCLGEPLSCVTNIVRATQAEYGDSIAVIGCGVMGLLSISALAGKALNHLIAIDLDDSRLEEARSYGATHTINPRRKDAEQVIFELTKGRGVDAVVEISGSLSALSTALSIIRVPERYGSRGRGKIVVGSLYAKETLWTPEMGYNLMLRVPEIHSVHPMYSRDLEEDVRRAVAGYIDGSLPIDRMISHVYDFSDITRGFEALNSGDPAFRKGVVMFNSNGIK